MRGLPVALALLVCPAVAAAHPIEPVLAGSPMPTPGGMMTMDASYSRLHDEQGATAEVAGGIGERGELFIAGEYDASEEKLGPVSVGAKILFLMEGMSAIEFADVALRVSLSSDESGTATLLVGRTLVPGFYLQGSLGLSASTAAPEAPALRHGGLRPEPGETLGFGSLAAQWAPIPRLIPTLEAQATTGGDWLIAPEIIVLPSINHLAVKAALPIHLDSGDVAVVFQLSWQG